MSDRLRALDPAEHYFWLSDQVIPTSAMSVAELAIELDPGEVRAALAKVQNAQPLLRAAIVADDGKLYFEPTSGEIPLAIDGSASAVSSGLEHELDTPFDDAALTVRCHYFRSAAGSTLALVARHAASDGRSLNLALQNVLRCIADPDYQPPVLGSFPPLHEHLPHELRSARGVVNALAAAREDRGGSAPPERLPFHQQHEPGHATRLDRLDGDTDQVTALRERARSSGATVNGLLSAAALQSVTALFEDHETHNLPLLTPVDLSERCVPPLPKGALGLAIGMLSSSYLVIDDLAELARTISERTHRQVDRGEAHLFYRLAKAMAFPATEAGVARFRTATEQSAQNVAMSNVGIIEDAGDPPWLRSVWATTTPAIQHVTFTAFTTYRGRLVATIMSDREKLRNDLADRIVQGIAARTGLTKIAESDAG